MSLGNIIDRRKNTYDVEVDAVFEPSWHDNSCVNATEFLQQEEDWSIDNMDSTTVEEAIMHCDTWDLPVTVYLYDKGSDPMGFVGDEGNYVEPINITTTESSP